MLRKIASLALCALVGTLSVMPASAAAVKVTGKDKIAKNGNVIFYGYNLPYTAPGVVELRNKDNKSEVITVNFSSVVNAPKAFSLSPTAKYDIMTGNRMNSGGSISGGQYTTFSYSKGEYEKIRIKLSDFSSYFNKDGTTTRTDPFNEGKTHNYNYSMQTDGEKTYASSLVIISGGAFNCVTPNKNGEVEIYVSKRLGAGVMYTTDFAYKKPGKSGSGGGTSGQSLGYLAKGDCNGNGYINIADSTAIQQYLVDKVKFDAAQKRVADTNDDGVIDIRDATIIQLYLADLYSD